MKKMIFLFSLLFMGTIFDSMAQQFADLQKSPTDIVYAKTDRRAQPDIKVIYSRPLKKGRTIFGELVPYNKVWRTGADEATEIKFYKETKLGEGTIKPGTYSLFTIPGEKEWTIIINADTDVWGAYNYNESKDIARIKVPVSSGKEIEAFSIAFQKSDKGYQMFLAWDTTMITVPLEQ